MPWKTFKRDGKYKVFKLDSEGVPTGEALGTHDSESEANTQVRALYANEPGAKAVKFAEGSQTEIVGLLAPNGGPFNGRDISGEYFSPNTDFVLDWFETRPLLYHHGLDGKTGVSVIGRIKTLSKDDTGLWMRAQLDAHHDYYSAIKELIDQGKLGLSSGSMRHLVEVNKKTGEILRWPLIEGSATPTPANPLAEVGFAEAKSHYKAIDIELPEAIGEIKLASGDMPEMSKKPVTAARMREMADEMGLKLSAEDIAAMDGMTEAEAKKKMQSMMAKKSVKAMSWENVRQECGAMIEQQLAAAMPFGDQPGYCSVEETYSDHIICCICKNEMERHYSVPFELGEDGHVAKLGTPTEVEETYVPVEGHNMDAMPVGMHAEMAMRYATSLLERTKDLRERRTKEGRVLSTATRKRLGQCLDSMRGACDEMTGLLDSTEPTAKAGDVRLRLDLLKLFAATL